MWDKMSAEDLKQAAADARERDPDLVTEHTFDIVTLGKFPLWRPNNVCTMTTHNICFDRGYVSVSFARRVSASS